MFTIIENDFKNPDQDVLNATYDENTESTEEVKLLINIVDRFKLKDSTSFLDFYNKANGIKKQSITTSEIKEFIELDDDLNEKIEKELENSIKIVLPSPHLYISQQMREIENDIYFNGEIMGGGKIKKSILEHMEKGYKVVMEPNCARTIRDDLEQVKAIGIEIAEEGKDYKDFTKITLGDINIKKLSEFLLGYDLEFDFDKIAIAVQDHGYNENMGDRDFNP